HPHLPCHSDRIHSPRRPDPLSSRASAASREISPLRASTAKIPRLATLARNDNGVVVHTTDSLRSLGMTMVLSFIPPTRSARSG
ncbi:hypothetical protein, partial [Bifidobacterium aquikefiri]|uniref:hypothetical protein n=1 Tax=Bifidobacterium aquikefiri TaxID=1653207 RepID=UPI0039E82999